MSTEDQHLDLQRDALTRAGCEKTSEDKKSGAKVDRPGLAAALEYARAGDQLVVWRPDRLGRSLPDLIALVRKLDVTGVQLRSVTRAIAYGVELRRKWDSWRVFWGQEGLGWRVLHLSSGRFPIREPVTRGMIFWR